MNKAENQLLSEFLAELESLITDISFKTKIGNSVSNIADFFFDVSTGRKSRKIPLKDIKVVLELIESLYYIDDLLTKDFLTKMEKSYQVLSDILEDESLLS